MNREARGCRYSRPVTSKNADGEAKGIDRRFEWSGLEAESGVCGHNVRAQES